MPEQLANDGQAETGAGTDACEGVPQIMKSETRQTGPFGNQCPWSLKVRTRLFIIGTGDNKFSDVQQVFQHCEGCRSEYDSFLSGFRVRQEQEPTLEIDMIPPQIEDLT
jgi:hypothetical protein